AAIRATLRKFPELIDRYIRMKEDDGDRAEAVSADKVKVTHRELVEQIHKAVQQLLAETDFYDKPWTSYEECLERVRLFKQYVENQDGYKLLNRGGEGLSTEKEVQLAFGLLWLGSDFDLNREANNGRGPVDFKASFGSGDKSLIEFKLASNSHLERGLQKQVPIYEKANRTDKSVKVIVYYTAKDERRVRAILK